MKTKKIKIIAVGVSLLMISLGLFFVSCNNNEDVATDNFATGLNFQKASAPSGGTIIEIHFGMRSKGRWPKNYCVKGGFVCILFLTHGEPPVKVPNDWVYSYYEKYGESTYAYLTYSKNSIDWSVSCKYATEDEKNDFLKSIEKGYIDFTEEVEIEEPEILKSMQVDNSVIIPVGQYKVSYSKDIDAYSFTTPYYEIIK